MSMKKNCLPEILRALDIYERELSRKGDSRMSDHDRIVTKLLPGSTFKDRGWESIFW